MNKQILRLALPSIVTNIVVPLLGLLDLTIAGHLGATAFIGAVTVGAAMFNFTYWNFGFLRMGTSGMTAQAFGRNDMVGAVIVLQRAALLGFMLGLIIIILQLPLQWLLLFLIGPGAEVRRLAEEYFAVCVWGAPAMLATMSLSGWFLGMQNSVYPMVVSITVNLLNIAVSLACVFLLGMGFRGIAVGTMVAQWGGLLLALALLWHFKEKRGLPFGRLSLRMQGLGRFFRVNSDIFLRSFCLMLVTLFFTSAGARSGDLILAVNALVMQLFTLYSYFMDGFAFAGEALAGKYAGAGDRKGLHRCISFLFAWGLAVMAVFAMVYGGLGNRVMALLTDDVAVLATASVYRWWATAIPVAGFAAFLWDGVYVGLTATRHMLAALLVATVGFFAVYYGLDWMASPEGFIADANNRLWIAFISYLLLRGIVQTLLAPRLLRLKIVVS